MKTTAGVKAVYLERVISQFRDSRPFKKLMQTINSGQNSEIFTTGLAGSSPAILLANLANMVTQPIIVIVAETDEANNLYDDLNFLMNEKEVAHFPSRMTPPYEFRSPSAEITGQRLATLSKLLMNDVKIVVAPIEAIIEPTMSLNAFEKERLHLRIGEEIDIGFLCEKLIKIGFQRVSLVEEVGDFALRGGLIDFFSPGFDYPVRVEFLGDTIDTIRQFDVATQRTMERLTEVVMLPRREIPITQQTIEQYIEKLPAPDADLIRARYLSDPELPGLEWLAVSFGIESGILFDFIPKESIWVLDSTANLKGAIGNVLKESTHHYNRIKERLEAP
ncbi:MAG: hypothetical protein NTV06_07625, partial [candidate division Zixibacteria bacterium]|nr:hypothetical protein [candidate division Zixibacteria bacterium]